ncbi:MAG: cysteine desulfurase [Desulfobacteraceae bacterium]|nr:cysteine desulfurase [Desulfobacteraceae bacterium]
MKIVYIDHASATPVRPEVKEAMFPYFDKYFANPSTVYDIGTRIKKEVDAQREKVADLIGAKGGEIIFTSSGAEANNQALKGVALGYQKKGGHIIVSGIEHHSVLNSARFLERLDFEVTYLPVDGYGLVDPERLRKSIRPETTLVSIMHGNNEIGTIEPIAELSSVCKEKGILFHTDAVGTVGNIPVDVNDLGVDLLSLSAVSMCGPKGIGALYVREKTRVMPLIHGGIQERGRRAGTENVPGIMGLGKAAELAKGEVRGKMTQLQDLRDALRSGISKHISRVHFTGHTDQRLPGHLSMCFEAIEGEALTFILSQQGIYINTGSACASKALKTSPVLVAISVKPEVAQGSAVFTIGSANTHEDITYVINRLPRMVERLRSYSPLWQNGNAR